MDEQKSGQGSFLCYGDIFAIRHHRKLATDRDRAGHKHAKDHITIVLSGRVRVDWKNDAGEDVTGKEYGAADFFIQDKLIEHNIIPLEDNSTWVCVFSLTKEEYNNTPVIADGANPYEEQI